MVYNNTVYNPNRVFAGIQTGDIAKWTLTLTESTQAKPCVRTDNEVPLYYMQHGNDRRYVNVGTSGTNRGRLCYTAYDYSDNANYLFYFAEGNEEGKFAIYSYAQNKSVIYYSKKIVANRDTDTPTDYDIDLNEGANGLTISSTEGNWNYTGNYVAYSATQSIPFKLFKAKTIYLTVDQTAVNLLSVGETATLTAETNTGNEITWSSSDENVATVDASGQITAMAEGTATITVTTQEAKVGTLTTTCLVTVGETDGISSTTVAANIQVQDGVIAISGLAEGTHVTVYSTTGNLIGAATANHGSATIDTNLEKGSIVIVKMGATYAKLTVR